MLQQNPEQGLGGVALLLERVRANLHDQSGSITFQRSSRTAKDLGFIAIDVDLHHVDPVDAGILQIRVECRRHRSPCIGQRPEVLGMLGL